MFYGLYSGIVVDNQDPDKSNRLQIRIPNIHGTNAKLSNITKQATGIPDENLPWATVVNAWSKQSKPYEINTLVYVAFESGFIDTPVVLGVKTKYSDKADIPEESYNDYVSTKSIKINEFTFYVNENDLNIYKTGGFSFLLNEDEIKMEKDDCIIHFDSKNKSVKIEIGGNFVEIDGNSGVVKIQGESQKAVLGDLLKTYLDSHTHVGNLGFPTAPPTVPMPPTTLSEKVKLV